MPTRAQTRTSRPIAAALLLAAVVAGCGVTVSTGSGEVATRTEEPASFDRLQVGAAFDVTVTPGERERVVVRVSEEVEDRVRTEVDGDTLVIEMERGLSLGDVTLEADVTAPTLRGVDASGAASVTLAQPLEADEVEVRVSGASRVDGEVNAERLDAEASGASRLELRGSAGDAQVSGRDASTLALAGLTVDTMDIDLSGASNGDVTVEGELSLRASGASDLSYAGSPDITSQTVTGASSVSGG